MTQANAASSKGATSSGDQGKSSSARPSRASKARNGASASSGGKATGAKTKSSGGKATGAKTKSSGSRGSAKSAQGGAKASRTRAKSQNGSRSASGSSGSSRGGGTRSSSPPSTRGRTSRPKRSSKAAPSGAAVGLRDRVSQASSDAGSEVTSAIKESGAKVKEGGKQAITSVGTPVATATIAAVAGVAGGVILGRNVLKRPRKVLGVPIPGTRAGLSDVVKQVSDAGKQFGKLASEVRTAREKAEQIGEILT